MEYPKGLNLTSPASEAAVSRLSDTSAIPKDYIDFLRESNGAEGFIGSSYLLLFRAEEIDPINRAADTAKFAPSLIIFASDGGGKSYAFDKKQEDGAIVEFFDADIGDEEPTFCAHTFAGFLEYLSKG